MPPNKTFTGAGPTANDAEQDAASKADPGTYTVEISGKVKKESRPQPNPIGDYKATLKGS